METEPKLTLFGPSDSDSYKCLIFQKVSEEKQRHAFNQQPIVVFCDPRSQKIVAFMSPVGHFSFFHLLFIRLRAAGSLLL